MVPVNNRCSTPERRRTSPCRIHQVAEEAVSHTGHHDCERARSAKQRGRDQQKHRADPKCSAPNTRDVIAIVASDAPWPLCTHPYTISIIAITEPASMLVATA
jgi:hypothetical protein